MVIYCNLLSFVINGDGMRLEELEVYKIAMSFSSDGWETYLQLPKQFKFNIGDQVLRSIDSIGDDVQICDFVF